MYEHGSRTPGKRFCIKLLVVIENNAATAGHNALDRWAFLHQSLQAILPSKDERRCVVFVCIL